MSENPAFQDAGVTHRGGNLVGEVHGVPGSDKLVQGHRGPLHCRRLQGPVGKEKTEQVPFVTRECDISHGHVHGQVSAEVSPLEIEQQLFCSCPHFRLDLLHGFQA